MNKHAICQTVVLGRSRYCSITLYRECNIFHFHIGPVSVRLKNEVFEDICETLIEIYREHSLQGKLVNVSIHNH